MTTHGCGGTTEYSTWCNMRQRCYDKNSISYKNYGGRGIKVCDRWLRSFESFLGDLGLRPSTQHSLDRIDNDGHYRPSNCRWATKLEQCNNTRSNILITIKNTTKNITQWASFLGMPRSTIYNRLARGWSKEEALGFTDRGNKKHHNLDVLIEGSSKEKFELFKGES